MRTLREFRQVLKQAVQDHELRHRPSRFGVALFDSIHHVPGDAWRQVVPEHRLFLQPHYLAALEDSNAATPGQGGLRHRYAVLFDGRQPVAAAAMQVLEVVGESMGSRAAGRDEGSGEVRTQSGLRRKVGRAIRRATDRLGLQVLVCGNAYVTGEHGFCHVAELDPVLAFDGLADAVYRVRRADKLHGNVAGVLIKDFYAPQRESARRLQQFGYREFAVDPQMVVPLRAEWRSFDDYVAAMTKKYRSRIRGVRRKGKDLRRQPLDAAAIERHHDRIRELFLAVHEKASFRIAPLPESYFEALAAALGDRFRLHGYFLDDRMVGFTTSIRWGDCLEGHYLGLDYEHNVPHAVYQNILYDDVQEAIEQGCRELNLGRTALEIKSGIGAEPRPVTCYMRHRNPASNAVVKPLFGLVKPTRWTPRNPFGAPDAAG